MSELYDEDFFEGQSESSVRSAEIIVPKVLSLFPVSSVVDVGCGTGGWLSVFEKNGVRDYIGFDGDYVSREALKIPAERFQPEDLVSLKTVGRKFGLACSLEVAEHLPEQVVAEQLVGVLVGATPVVLFSAAVPHQGGTNHINEQWQSYWSKLFLHHNFHAYDCIRPSIFGDKQVEWWYRQNCIVYCDDEHSPKSHNRITDPYLLDRVDPDMLAHIAGSPHSGRGAISLIWKSMYALRKSAMKRF